MPTCDSHLPDRTLLRRATRLRLAAGVALVAAALIGPAAVCAQAYSVYGSVSAEARYTWNELAAPAPQVSVPLAARLTHSLAADAFDLTARTVVVSAATVADPAATQIRVPELSLSTYLTPWLTTRVGRFGLDWGSSYVFAPGNALYAAASGADGGGVNGVSISVIPAPSVSIGAAVSLTDLAPTETARPWEEFVSAAWVDGFVAGVDWFAGFQYGHDTLLRPSVAASLDVLGTIIAAEAAVELAERHTYPNETYDFVGRDDPAAIAAVALQHSLAGRDVSASAMVEYLYTGLGFSAEEADRIYDLALSDMIDLPTLGRVRGLGLSGASEANTMPDVGTASDAAPLGQHYLASEISFDWYDHLTVSLSGVVNLTDAGFIATSEITVVALTALDLYVRGGLMWGPSRRTEFGVAGHAAEIAVGARVNM